jgi:hypothetical protein
MGARLADLWTHATMAVTVAALASGCAGHGSLTFRGTVLSADRARYEFVNRETTTGTPLADSRVDLYLHIHSEALRCGTPPTERGPQASSTTTENGLYQLESVFGSMLFSPDTLVLICVSHPRHQTLEYRMSYEETPRVESDGTRFLNFYLLPK